MGHDNAVNAWVLLAGPKGGGHLCRIFVAGEPEDWW
jgi:hypothetical protein